MPFRFPNRLYPIADNLGDTRRSHVAIASEIAHAGAPLLQLRAKSLATAEIVAAARAVRAVTVRTSTLLIINDRADIARLVDADGVHLGQDDLAADAARAILGAHKIIGLSTHSLAQALEAQRAAVVDYIGFGPIYVTTSKADPDPVQGLAALRTVRAHCRLPIVAIGGITPANMAAVLDAGADAVAMIGAIVGAKDIGAKVRELLQRNAD